jgi:hypothetical protein
MFAATGRGTRPARERAMDDADYVAAFSAGDRERAGETVHRRVSVRDALFAGRIGRIKRVRAAGASMRGEA